MHEESNWETEALYEKGGLPCSIFPPGAVGRE